MKWTRNRLNHNYSSLDDNFAGTKAFVWLWWNEHHSKVCIIRMLSNSIWLYSWKCFLSFYYVYANEMLLMMVMNGSLFINVEGSQTITHSVFLLALHALSWNVNAIFKFYSNWFYFDTLLTTLTTPSAGVSVHNTNNLYGVGTCVMGWLMVWYCLLTIQLICLFVTQLGSNAMYIILCFLAFTRVLIPSTNTGQCTINVFLCT